MSFRLRAWPWGIPREVSSSEGLPGRGRLTQIMAPGPGAGSPEGDTQGSGKGRVMGIFSRLNQSGALLDGMAERLGVDLGAGMDRAPDAAAARYRAMVLACAGCAERAACTGLQAANARLEAAPDYCRNRERLAVG